MNKVYYKKRSGKKLRKIIRLLGLSLSFSGLLGMLYFFFPLISWQLYLAPVFASENIAIPIPKTTIINESMLQSLAANRAASIFGTDYNDAKNWFPAAQASAPRPVLTSYLFSVPKLKIINAKVSTVDNDLASHLVNYNGTAIPPYKGNAVIFGHSTLPQLFNPKDYKTIFATAHTLKTGDIFIVTIDSIQYTYRIFSITIVDPEDTSALTQTFDDSYLTVITCTPPGTTWKRLVLKSKLEKI